MVITTAAGSEELIGTVKRPRCLGESSGQKMGLPVLGDSRLITMWASHLKDIICEKTAGQPQMDDPLSLCLDMRRHRKCVWIGIQVAYLSGAVHRVPKGRAWAFSGAV